ncbi:MAG: FG-GAP-like repeat-containing protein, partial [Candidatus Fermentibacter sp.]|nr:FG-GAP-like repeat-containing protein [Candidatus Fermentibacter sp.]
MRTASAICIPLLLLAVPAFADSATQTSWIGGPGVPGPVGSWGDSYSESSPECQCQSGYVSLLEMMEHTVFPSGGGYGEAVAGDLDGDGDNDLIHGFGGYDQLYWFENNGSGSEWESHYICYETMSSDLTCSDLDGDGDQDILFSNSAGAYYLLWFENEDGQGGSWSDHGFPGTIPWTPKFATVDVEPDGDQDIILFGDSTDPLYIAVNLGGSGLDWDLETLNSTGCLGGSVGDIDGDGDPDFAGARYGCLCWYENGDTDIWAMNTVSATSDPQRVEVLDVDDDGDMDLVSNNVEYDDMLWFENLDGQGASWQEHLIYGLIDMPRSIAAADLDGDGDADAACGSRQMSLENGSVIVRNGGSSWHAFKVQPTGVAFVSTGDMDSDGIEDALVSDLYEGSLKWFRLLGGSVEASLESSILYVGCDPDWTGITWTAVTPSGTSVSFQVRSSDDFTDMGEWSGPIATPCSLSGILEDCDSYVQYRAILSRTVSGVVPVLYDVTISWNNLGTPEEEPPVSFTVLPVSPNPAHGALSITFGVPSAATVELSVYDLAGRVVFRTGPAGYQAGYHDIQPGELSPGVYLAVGRSDGIRSTVRFTVL